MALVVRPVTASRWDDFARLFSSKGCPHYCWCMPYRDRKSHEMTKTQRRAAMRKRVKANTPVGVLAYDDGEAVGWCSVAPRETFPKLENSYTMPRVDDEPTWTILCLFVRRDHRRQGVTKALLEGAVSYAKKKGATRVEAYPFDTAGVTSQHRGHSTMYEQARFEQQEKRWVRRVG